MDGIITGVGKLEQNKSASEMRMKELIANKYALTLHIDNDSVIETNSRTKEFEEYTIDAAEEEWSKKAIAIIEEIEKRANKK